MSTENNAAQNDANQAGSTQGSNENLQGDELIAKLVKEKVDAVLAEIKPKLDNAYQSRDEALKKLAEFEQKEKELQIKKLEEEGKLKEAYELKLAESNAKISALEKSNTELSRDTQVRSALSGLDWRNDVASEMAYREVVANLVRNDKGQWVHSSGVSIKDYIGQFAKDENWSFLFKPKSSSGAGTTQTNSGTSTTTKKSVFEMSQAEVLAKAAKGEFGKIPQF